MHGGRRDATIACLVEATLRCLRRDGYASLTIASITQEAGLSRGALFHHFATKLELTAQAMTDFFRDRRDRLGAAVASSNAAGAAMGERLDFLRDELRRDRDLYLEIVIALRTDIELRALILDVIGALILEIDAICLGLFPEARESDDSAAAIATLKTFIHGAFIDELLPNHRDEAVYSAFRDMLAVRLTAQPNGDS